MRVCKKKKERICNKSNHYLKYLVELREFQSLIVLGQKLNHGKHHFGQGWTKLFLDCEQSLIFLGKVTARETQACERRSNVVVCNGAG